MVKRRKSRKGKDSPTEKRMKDKNGEVAIARGRLAGALKGILNKNPDDSDETELPSSQSSNSSSKKIPSDSSPALWKKQSNKTNESEDHHSCLMKLFDRSVDLAQFDVNTPLYPICRAWIRNKPTLSKKNNKEIGLLETKHVSGNTDNQFLELNERLVNNKIDESDFCGLPPAKPLPEGVQTLRIPSPVSRKIERINLNADPESAPSREELLQSHLTNWSNVKKRWRLASLKNEERYSESKEILTKMLERFVSIDYT